MFSVRERARLCAHVRVMFIFGCACVQSCGEVFFFTALAFSNEEHAHLQLSIFLTCVGVNVVLMAFVLNALAITPYVRRCQIRYACFMCFIDV